jgi:hypothetical protein
LGGGVIGAIVGKNLHPLRPVDGALMGGLVGVGVGLTSGVIINKIMINKAKAVAPSEVKEPPPKAAVPSEPQPPSGISPIIPTMIGTGTGAAIGILTTRKARTKGGVVGGLIGFAVGLGAGGVMKIMIPSAAPSIPSPEPFKEPSVSYKPLIVVSSVLFGLTSSAIIAPMGDKTKAAIIGGLGSGAMSFVGGRIKDDTGAIIGGLIGVIVAGVFSSTFSGDHVYRSLTKAVDQINRAKALSYDALADFSEARRVSGDLMDVDQRLLNPAVSENAATRLKNAMKAAGASIRDYDTAVCKTLDAVEEEDYGDLIKVLKLMRKKPREKTESHESLEKSAEIAKERKKVARGPRGRFVKVS